MTISEMLHNIDKKCFESNDRVYDLQGLYEATNNNLTGSDKQELRNLLNSTDDPNMVVAFLQTKEAEKDGSLSEDCEECPTCPECGGKMRVNECTGSYFCPTCEDYLVETSMNLDKFISDDFWYEKNGKAYEAWYMDDPGSNVETYAIMEYPDWDATENPDTAGYLFDVDSTMTVADVIEAINNFIE